MIAHMSILSTNPKETALFFATIIERLGKSSPFFARPIKGLMSTALG